MKLCSTFYMTSLVKQAGVRVWAREEVVYQGQYGAGIAPLVLEGYRFSNALTLYIFTLPFTLLFTRLKEIVLCQLSTAQAGHDRHSRFPKWSDGELGLDHLQGVRPPL